MVSSPLLVLSVALLSRCHSVCAFTIETHRALSKSKSKSSPFSSRIRDPTRFTPIIQFRSKKRNQILCLNAENDPRQAPAGKKVDGTGRGVYLLVLSLIVAIWFFTIPTELRRTHWCFSERCEQHPSEYLCYNCVSFGEWKNQVVDYYRNGGGVVFDFTVGEETKALYAGKP